MASAIPDVSGGEFVPYDGVIGMPPAPADARLAEALAVLRQTPTGAWLDDYLRASGASIEVYDELQWAALGYPLGVVAATTGSSIVLRGTLLDDTLLSALTIAHEATHVLDVREGVFAPPAGTDLHAASRHAADMFARLGLDEREGAAWGWHGRRVSWELASEAHAYRNQAVVARELGLVDGGSAVGRGMDASGRVFRVSEAVAAMATDPRYATAYADPAFHYVDAGTAVGGGPCGVRRDAGGAVFLGSAGWHRGT